MLQQNMRGVPSNTLGSLARRLALYAARAKISLQDAYGSAFGAYGKEARASFIDTAELHDSWPQPSARQYRSIQHRS
jgi:hypothetical protein